MKSFFLILIVSAFSLTTISFIVNKENKTISFNVRGNGKTNVSLGVGYQVGSGACCRGVSKESTVGFLGNIGDILYDSDSRKVITMVYAEMEGKTIELRQYY